jgi:hypothetical protein
MRYRMLDLPPGPGREDALRAYRAHAASGPTQARGADDPPAARSRVTRALDTEMALLEDAALHPEERRRLVDALRRARRAAETAA